MRTNQQSQYQTAASTAPIHNGHTATAESHEIEDKYNFHDASFRRHFQLNYVDTGRDYEEFYAPAYRYGFELAEEHAGASWEVVQSEAQQHWNSNHESAWSDIADAIRYGWEEQRHPEQLRVHHHGEFEDFQTDFEEHYAEAFADAGPAFAHYAPAYRYGYDLAIDPEHRTLLWADMEPDVRKYWEEEYREQLPWESYRNATRHAWETIRLGAAGV
jgi:hypothetical protein